MHLSDLHELIESSSKARKRALTAESLLELYDSFKLYVGVVNLAVVFCVTLFIYIFCKMLGIQLTALDIIFISSFCAGLLICFEIISSYLAYTVCFKDRDPHDTY